jgi:translation initiation factor IF-3
VLDEDKQQIGVLPLVEALRLAQAKGLDLVEIVPNATPPVCRIVNYGKLMYEEAKNQKESRNQGTRMKELQLSANIDPHDFGVKLSHAVDFLCDDMKVRIKLRFRGRQRAHKEVGFDLINRFLKEASAYGAADAPPKLLGERDLTVVLSPLPRNKRAQNPKGPGNRSAEPEAEAPAPDEGQAPKERGNAPAKA